jgi:exoribonuclease-2
MLENGFEPDFPPQVTQQLTELKAHPPQVAPGGRVHDPRNLLWSSIDNDTSRDLDQVEERLPSGDIKVPFGIAGSSDAESGSLYPQEIALQRG